MKVTTAVSALMLAASVQAQGWLQNALNSCVESEQTCQNTLSSQMAYQDITCELQLEVDMEKFTN